MSNGASIIFAFGIFGVLNVCIGYAIAIYLHGLLNFERSKKPKRSALNEPTVEDESDEEARRRRRRRRRQKKKEEQPVVAADDDSSGDSNMSYFDNDSVGDSNMSFFADSEPEEEKPKKTVAVAEDDEARRRKIEQLPTAVAKYHEACLEAHAEVKRVDNVLKDQGDEPDGEAVQKAAEDLEKAIANCLKQMKETSLDVDDEDIRVELTSYTNEFTRDVTPAHESIKGLQYEEASLPAYMEQVEEVNEKTISELKSIVQRIEDKFKLNEIEESVMEA